MTNPFRPDNPSNPSPPSSHNTHRLSRRERQIMEILFREGRASAAEVQAALPDPPGYSAVRALLRILEEKGHITHIREGQYYVFLPKQARQSAAISAMRQVVQTFFSGSVEKAVTTLLSESEVPLSEDELTRLSELIAEAKQRDVSHPNEKQEKPE